MDEQDVKLQRQMTAEVVAAYAGNHKLSGDQLAALISSVHGALTGTSVEPELERTPAVPIRRSVQRDYVVLGLWLARTDATPPYSHPPSAESRRVWEEVGFVRGASADRAGV